MHRAGPLVCWTFFNRAGAGFNSPTVFALVQWWVHHRHRTGAQVSQALPLPGVGIQLSGDLLSLRIGTALPEVDLRA
jgi:hypothetical protein